MEGSDSITTVSSTPLSQSYTSSSPSPSPPPVVLSPCAACKILRQRCAERCVLAPYFPPTDPAKFAIAHRVFGASNIIKFLQMLLDTQAVKTILLDIPPLGRQGKLGYGNGEVILSPIDSVADTYRALLPEGTPMEFQRILELKGFKKADQQSILDDFNKHGPGITQPLASPSAPLLASSTPPAPTISSPSTVGLMASREDVLTRAAALGRGATTTGFKRFLALTEAAKDRKDGPFRKLFNP